VYPDKDPAGQQSDEETPEQLQIQVQATVTPPLIAHSLPTFGVVGEFRTAIRTTGLVITTSTIRGLTRIDRREVGAEPGDSVGWTQTMFRARMQADYYTAEGEYVESNLKERNRPLTDVTDESDIWYNPAVQFGGGDPVVGAAFEDSPQAVARLTSPTGGLLTRCAASWEFGCWLITRTPGGRVRFLHHQDWSASFHAEYRDGVTTLSDEEVSLGDAGPGSGTLTPLLEGPFASTFLDAPGTWSDLGGERLPQGGVDFT
jgi:hypothetical protein